MSEGASSASRVDTSIYDSSREGSQACVECGVDREPRTRRKRTEKQASQGPALVSNNTESHDSHKNTLALRAVSLRNAKLLRAEAAIGQDQEVRQPPPQRNSLRASHSGVTAGVCGIAGSFFVQTRGEGRLLWSRAAAADALRRAGSDRALGNGGTARRIQHINTTHTHARGYRFRRVPPPNRPAIDTAIPHTTLCKACAASHGIKPGICMAEAGLQFERKKSPIPPPPPPPEVMSEFGPCFPPDFIVREVIPAALAGTDDS
ncbi:hypothetical protein L1887_48421 [Cichorium endivia]|nr:hypothetical protein L1887_48421 [Cichorium endivia]